MVSYAGAVASEPYVAQIDVLNAAVSTLAATIAAKDTIGEITLQVFSSDKTQSNTIVIQYPLNAADSTAILNDIRNVLANEVNILTNTLGQIT